MKMKELWIARNRLRKVQPDRPVTTKKCMNVILDAFKDKQMSNNALGKGFIDE